MPPRPHVRKFYHHFEAFKFFFVDTCRSCHCYANFNEKTCHTSNCKCDAKKEEEIVETQLSLVIMKTFNFDVAFQDNKRTCCCFDDYNEKTKGTK
jgi:hypothetical protein